MSLYFYYHKKFYDPSGLVRHLVRDPFKKRRTEEKDEIEEQPEIIEKELEESPTVLEFTKKSDELAEIQRQLLEALPSSAELEALRKQYQEAMFARVQLARLLMEMEEEEVAVHFLLLHL